MVRKKVEGDEEQRRAAGRAAHRAGESPSARGATTGASKQRTHLTDRSTRTHEERLATPHKGKQRWQGEQARAAGAPSGPEKTESAFAGRGRPAYTDDHEVLFRALVEAEEAHGGGAALDEIARIARISHEKARVLMHDLVTTHRLARQVPDTGRTDLGPLYEVRPGG
ncbi:hypothetical protein [Streptomyces albus]|uniref:hypothetical protein n=1 Tax=Streptomyces albus TaxID=1888 RepID=UPI0004C7C901|nr:hypothetical protein [Streptomyces albus]